LIIKGLRNYKGKDNAISGTLICNTINEKELLKSYKLTTVRLRKIVGHIRVTGKLMYLCSSSKGYYVAKDTQEFDDCIESLEQRVAQQQLVIKSLTWQRNNYEKQR
jgi:hypothetical protein